MFRPSLAVALTNPKDPYDHKPLVHDKHRDKDGASFPVEVVENPEPGKYDFKVERHPKAPKGK